MKFLHTADWHLGYHFSQFSPQQNRELSRARIEMIYAMFNYARKNSIPLILAAGDQFEDGNTADKKLLLELFSILHQYPEIELIMIAGNHDPLIQDNIYYRVDRIHYPKNLTLVEDNSIFDRYEYGCKIYASSLKEKNGDFDPTGWIDDDEKDELKIALIHGSLAIEGKYNPEDFPILPDAAKKKKLDYLALGHWHSYYKHDEFTYYPGIPEMISFKDVGFVLEVHLQKGRVPSVKKIDGIRQYNWEVEKREIKEGDFESFVKKEVKPDPRRILKLILEGYLSIGNYKRLQEYLGMLEVSFYKLFVENNIIIKPADDEVARISSEGYMKNILTDLLEIKKGKKEFPLEASVDVDRSEIVDECLMKIYQFFKRNGN